MRTLVNVFLVAWMCAVAVLAVLAVVASLTR